MQEVKLSGIKNIFFLLNASLSDSSEATLENIEANKANLVAADLVKAILKELEGREADYVDKRVFAILGLDKFITGLEKQLTDSHSMTPEAQTALNIIKKDYSLLKDILYKSMYDFGAYTAIENLIDNNMYIGDQVDVGSFKSIEDMVVYLLDRGNYGSTEYVMWKKNCAEASRIENDIHSDLQAVAYESERHDNFLKQSLTALSQIKGIGENK